MSLDVYLEIDGKEVFWANITHNLNSMAEAAGIYQHLWRPEEIGITKAAQLVTPLFDGLERLKKFPQVFSVLDSPNGWGLYENFVPWTERYYRACCEYPAADVSASR